MRIKAGPIKAGIVLMIGVLIMQLLVIVSPVQAEKSPWNSFSDSINQSFSGNNAFSSNGIIVLLITALLCLVLFCFFRWYFSKEEEARRASRQIFEEKRQAKAQQPGQQRNWFRLKTDAQLKWIDTGQADDAKESQFNKDCLVDISGGGLCFATAEELTSGDELFFILDMGGGKPLSFFGRIVRIDEDKDSEDPRYNISIQFVNLPNGERDRLVSWILKNQRNAIIEEPEEEENPFYSD